MQFSQGTQRVADKIFPAIYDELKRTAGGDLTDERDEHPPPMKPVKPRFFLARTFEETAKVPGISPRTAKRRRQRVGARLYRNSNRT